MKRAVEDKIKELVKASKNVEADIARHKEAGNGVSEIYVRDLEKLRASYEKLVFEAVRDGCSADAGKSSGGNGGKTGGGKASSGNGSGASSDAAKGNSVKK